jgi:hypothetical protein
MAVSKPVTTAQASMTVLVNRDAPGDLVAGVRDRLERVAGVLAVESVDVRGVRPSLNDLRVEVDATLRVRVDAVSPDDRDPPVDPAAVERLLADGFGVRDPEVS